MKTPLNKDARIFVAGHRGLVGSAVLRRLEAQGFRNPVTRSRSELDLRDRKAVDAFYETEKPDYVILAAAKVGGIHANNTYPADFLYDNLAIQTNVIDAAWRAGVRKLVFLGSSCIYPRLAQQPLTEAALLTGPLEPTNEAYAIAKISGLKLTEMYRRQHGFDAISLMPTNLYGPGDNFDLNTSHVIPALMRKIHEAKISGAKAFEIWGSGNPLREFLHVDDLADAIIFTLEHYSETSPLNVGTGEDLSIRDLAKLIADVVGFEGDMSFDPSKPDGTLRKVLDVSRLHALGWRHSIPLKQGLQQTYDWYAAGAGAISARPAQAS